MTVVIYKFTELIIWFNQRNFFNILMDHVHPGYKAIFKMWLLQMKYCVGSSFTHLKTQIVPLDKVIVGLLKIFVVFVKYSSVQVEP